LTDPSLRESLFFFFNFKSRREGRIEEEEIVVEVVYNVNDPKKIVARGARALSVAKT
jgi:hypothetical protein